MSIGQLTFYWDVHLWPRLQGLTDDEFRWRPAPDRAWDLDDADGGRLRLVDPPPDAVVVPTIAWRMAHVAVGCFATRVSTFFGDGSVPEDADMFDARHRPADLQGDALGAVTYLHDSYQAWRSGIAGLSQAELEAPLGPRGGPYAEDSMAALVLHVNRETMHHGGEIGLLRDLYAARPLA